MKDDVQIKTAGSQADIVEIVIRGFLDTMAAYSLQEHVQTLLEEGKRKYLINLEELTQVSSAGIGFFSGLVMELRKYKGELVLVHIPEQVQHLFTITRLIELFTVCDSVAAALARLENIPEPVA